MIITKAIAATSAEVTAAAGSAASTAAGSSAARSSAATGTGTASSAATSAASANGVGSSSSAQSTAAQQSDRFLKLLVAQMRNQDPLNPMDNAAVTTQMAQISTVEGIEKLNKNVSQYMDRGSGLSSLDGANLIGRQVLVKGDSLALGSAAADGSRAAAQGGFELSGDAPRATIDILDASGAVIASQQQASLSAGVHRFEWDGTSNSGAFAAAGNYRFRVTAGTGASTTTVTTLAAKPVTAVLSGGDGPRLEIGGNSQLTVADIRAILQEKN